MARSPRVIRGAGTRCSRPRHADRASASGGKGAHTRVREGPTSHGWETSHQPASTPGERRDQAMRTCMHTHVWALPPRRQSERKQGRQSHHSTPTRRAQSTDRRCRPAGSEAGHRRTAPFHWMTRAIGTRDPGAPVLRGSGGSRLLPRGRRCSPLGRSGPRGKG